MIANITTGEASFFFNSCEMHCSTTGIFKFLLAVTISSEIVCFLQKLPLLAQTFLTHEKRAGPSVVISNFH